MPPKGTQYPCKLEGRKSSNRLAGKPPEFGLLEEARSSRLWGGVFGLSFERYGIKKPTSGYKTPYHRTKKLVPTYTPTPKKGRQATNVRYSPGRRTFFHKVYNLCGYEVYADKKDANEFLTSRHQYVQQRSGFSTTQKDLQKLTSSSSFALPISNFKQVCFYIQPHKTSFQAQCKNMGHLSAGQYAERLGFIDEHKGKRKTSTFHYAHLQASMYGGKADQSNLVVTTYACNYCMLMLEYALSLFVRYDLPRIFKKNHIEIKCEVFCELHQQLDSDTCEYFATHMGKSIEYKILWEEYLLLRVVFQCQELSLPHTFYSPIYRQELINKFAGIQQLWCDEKISWYDNASEEEHYPATCQSNRL